MTGLRDELKPAVNKLFFPDGEEGMRRRKDRLAVLWVGGVKNCLRRLFHRLSAVFGQQVGGIEEAESAFGDLIRRALTGYTIRKNGLRNSLHRKDLGCGCRIFEPQDPLTGNITTIHLRRLKFPTLRGLHRVSSKIFARPRSIELCSHHAA